MRSVDDRGAPDEVHPRIRGEDMIDGRIGYGLGGSPPHTRGRLRSPREREARAGFTPAYAGKIQIP